VRLLQVLWKRGSGSGQPHFVVLVGPDILRPDILPPLHLDEFGLFELPVQEVDEAWQELGSEFEPSSGVMEALHRETGGSKLLTLEILGKAGRPAAWSQVAKALHSTVKKYDGLLGALRQFILERPDVVEAVHRFSLEEELSANDEFRLLTLGIVRHRDGGLQYAGPVFNRFVEHFFDVERLAEFYQTQKDPLREQMYWRALVESRPTFASYPSSRRAEIFQRLADLASTNQDEDAFFSYSRKYLRLVGPADQYVYLESAFVPKATEIVRRHQPYEDYRKALDKFLTSLSVITNQPDLLLYTQDPTNPGTVVCRACLPLANEQKMSPVSLDDANSMVARIMTGQEEELDIPDVFREPSINEGFVRKHGIRSMILWPLAADGRRFGTVILENPYLEKHPLRAEARPIALEFIQKTQIMVERAALVASEVQLLAGFRKLLEATRAGNPSDLVKLALQIIQDLVPQIRFSAVRLYEGSLHRRMRLIGHHPDDPKDEGLQRLLEDFKVIEADVSFQPGVKQPFYKPDISTLPPESPFRQLMETHGLLWVMISPLSDNGEAIGRVTLYGQAEWKPRQKDLQVLESVSQQITIALRNIYEKENNLKRERLLKALYSGVARLTEKRPESSALEEFLHQMLDACCKAFEADVAHCLRLRKEAHTWLRAGEVLGEEEDEFLDLLASAGQLAPQIHERVKHIKVGQGLSGSVVQKAMADPEFTARVIPDVEELPEELGDIAYVPGIRSSLAIALRRLGGRVLGVLTLDSQKFDAFDDRSIALAKDVARELAIAIEFVDLFDALARQSAVDEMGLVVADLAHWLGNVLPLISNRVERGLQAMLEPSPERSEIATKGLKEASKLLKLAIQMREELQYSELWNQPQESVSLREATESAIASLPDRAPKDAIEVQCDEDLPQVSGYGKPLLRMVHAILRNAQDAVGDKKGGKIAVSLKIAEDSPPAIHLRIMDNGPGVEPSKLRDLMRPFKSTKPPTQGTGLGLWTVRKVVEHHGGRLRFDTEAGQGMTVNVWLPLTNSQEESK